ncbi:MAG: hypothetical protein QF464_11155, partial [Myxococcota bacterium]|nr:hypothetical protein [Myxococcota bacterium]
MSSVDALATITFRRAALLVALLALAVHAQAVGHAFTWNDGTNLVTNEAITDVAHIPSFFTEPWGATAEDATYRARNSQYWRPIPLTMWTLEVALFGLSPGPLHAISVLLHGVAAIFLLLFLWRLLPTPGPRRAGVVLGAIAWAVHPVHTEVVQVVSYRSDLLAGLFTLAALAVWLGPQGRSERHGRRDRWFLVPVLFGLGVGSKEMAVTVPV